MGSSRAWREFLVNLREATTLLRSDPTSEYARRAAAAHGLPAPTSSVPVSDAINKGCALLLSGRLQGCIGSLLEEFLERVDQSGVVVDRIPENTRAELCRWYVDARGRLTSSQTKDVHKHYAVLWTSGSTLPPGTIKTDSFSDEGNPWPDHVQGLVARCGVDLKAGIVTRHGQSYWDDLVTYVGELIAYRNAVAHGDNPGANWSAQDVRRHMTWATRMARACDVELGLQLATVTGAGW